MIRYAIIIFSLMIGLFIYVVFRDTSSLFYNWAVLLLGSNALDDLRYIFSNLSVPVWFVYSMPDGLWMFSFVLLILTIWDFQFNKDGLIWIGVAVTIGFVIEFTQMYFSKLGRFDWMDILFITIGAILPVFLSAIKIKFELTFFNHKLFTNEQKM